MEGIMSEEKIKKAQKRLEAAQRRTLAAHQREYAAACYEQAASPAYIGQDVVCLNKAQILEALADENEAKADLLEAEAE
jgi:hypothetical protein